MWCRRRASFKLVNKIVEPVPKSKAKLRLDIFICAFLGQSVWIFTLSESTAFGTLVGVSGPAWYALAAAMPTVLFMIPLVRCRMIAPGAQTFLHVIYGRFGRSAHLMFCTFALLNNLSIVATMIETGNRIFSSISTEITFDLVWIVAITIAGICVSSANLRQVVPVCIVGSGFLMLSTMAFFIGVFFLSSNPKLGSIEKIYEKNVVEKDLYSDTINRMSFRNWYTWLVATGKFFRGLTPIFMDQATWQTCCYSAPGEESIGVAVSSMLWMTIPYAFATACSNGFVALTPHEELVNLSRGALCSQPSVIVAKALFGRVGLLVLFVIFAFIIANISVFQLFSISSILTFDIYAIHMRPFRVCFDVNCCILCGKTRDLIFRPKENCECVPVPCCRQCQIDRIKRCAAKGPILPPCECRIHAKYMDYRKLLANMRRTSVLVIFSVILPIGLLFNFPAVKSVALNGGINTVVSATLGSLLYSFFWERMTSAGVVIGTALSSSVAGSMWILLKSLTALHPNFDISADVLDNMLFAVAIVGGFVFPLLVVWIERFHKRFRNEDDMDLRCQPWHRIYEMDNPLAPWAFEFAESFSLSNFDMESYNRPDPEEVRKAYRRSWYFALGGPILYLVLYSLVIPGPFYAVSVLDIVFFKAWIYLVLVILVVSAAVTLFMPIVWEGIHLYYLRRTQKKSRDEQRVNSNIEFVIPLKLRSYDQLMANQSTDVTTFLPFLDAY
ncbi:Urea-proton symporter DUR3 [Taenia crassiceps]|uniref:Urea-proton symporter DUR3 n=1 Tax=Taenia crassiceps TaxID=6207 RepID=A0ABR4QD22_9CEST